MIFKFKRLNHFKQRMQSLSVVLQNQKANQYDGVVNMFINKNRGSNEKSPSMFEFKMYFNYKAICPSDLSVSSEQAGCAY